MDFETAILTKRRYIEENIDYAQSPIRQIWVSPNKYEDFKLFLLAVGKGMITNDIDAKNYSTDNNFEVYKFEMKNPVTWTYSKVH